MPVATRVKYMNDLADAIEERLEEFAVAESCDQGKPVWLARKLDIPRAVYNLRYFAGYVLHHPQQSSQQTHFGVVNYTLQQPSGVAGLIAPWNLPMYLLTFKMAPALAAGCTLVAKPSEMTSVTTWMMCHLARQVGIPHGVINVVFGRGDPVGSALVRHPSVPIISFTGSTATAEKIRLGAAPYCKKLSLELGGKNPCVVFSDVDLNSQLADIVRSCFTNQGEVCLATSRLFVHRDIFATFLAAFVAAAKQLTVGDPSDEDTKVGALISAEHLKKVSQYVELARQEKARVECGGQALDSEGYFYPPTVITDISDTSRLMTEEIFGPVVCVVPFDNEDEVVARANAVQYGLSASVWTSHMGRALRVANRLQAGTVWTNCWMVRDLAMPFGGCKQSGIGREGGQYSLDFYTEYKTVCLKYT